MLDFLIDIVSLFFLFDYFFNYLIAFPIAIIFTFIKDSRINDLFMHVFSRIIFIILYPSLSAIIVLKHSTKNSNIILLAIIAGVLLLINIIHNFSVWKQNAIEISNQKGFGAFDPSLGVEFKYDFIFKLLAFVIFILSFFFPIIGTNPINKFFLFLMDFILNIPIIKWIIIIFSILYVIKEIWKIYFYLFYLFDKED